jgi:hypothetical protein
MQTVAVNVIGEMLILKTQGNTEELFLLLLSICYYL